MTPRRTMWGFTLIELIIAIVVFAAALAGLTAAVLGGTTRSADPQIQAQGRLIARAYLEEALLRAYDDPDGVDEGCAVPRGQWDDLQDYGDCLGTPTAPTDQFGNVPAGLGDYRVAVTVSPATINGVATRQVEVAVTHVAQGLDLRLAGNRADF